MKVETDPEWRTEQFRRLLAEVASERKVVLLVDGLSETAEAEPRFVDPVFECQYPGVVWVCAGQDSDDLMQRFGRGRCFQLFERGSRRPALRVERDEDEGLLPPLGADNVREFLVTELGHHLAELFGRDRQQATGEWSNEYLEEVIRKSDGLPLYLALLAEDLRRDPDAFARGTETKLPRGLEGYFEKLAERMDDDVRVLTALLASAPEPLTLDTLRVLLSDHYPCGSSQGEASLREALGRGNVVFRRAPTSTMALGYGVFHGSFREYVLNTDKLRFSRATAKARLCALAGGWSQQEAGGSARHHALQFGPRTLTGAEEWGALAALLTDLGFIEARCREVPGGARGLVRDYNLCAKNAALPQPVRDRLAPWARFARAYAGFLARQPREVLPTTPCPEGPVQAIAVSGRVMVTGHANGAAQVWDLDTGEPGRILEGHRQPINGVALTADGRRAVTVSADWTARVWETGSGRCIHRLTGHRDRVSAVCLASDWRILTASEDRSVRTWDLRTGRSVGAPLWHGSSAHGIAVLPGDTHLITAGSSGVLVVFDSVGSRALARHVPMRTGTIVNAISVAPGGKWTAIGRTEEDVPVWAVGTRGVRPARVLGKVGGDHGRGLRFVTGVAVTPGGRHVVTGSSDHSVRLWDARRGGGRVLGSHRAWVRQIAVTRDGRRVPSASDDGTVRVWHPGSRRCIRILRGHASWVWGVAVTPDGTRAVSASDDGTARVWDLVHGGCIRTFRKHRAQVRSMALLPGSRLAVTGDHDGVVMVWNPQNGRVRGELRGHTASVGTIPALPDGRVVTGSEDRTIRVWDVERKGDEEVACFAADSHVVCLDVLGAGSVVAGDNLGHIYLLDLVG
ncbi:MAG: WD40 repeat domain-containing protein [Armatimonadetes bacterium]|nr:WD40 repeat domain-containing protein [Armatimonadota bacterium]